MARETYAALIEKSLKDSFKEECKRQGYKQNEVLEILMTGFVDGSIQIEKKITYKINQRKE